MICCRLGYRTDVSVGNKAPGVVTVPCWASDGLAEKDCTIWTCCSDSVAIPFYPKLLPN